MSYAYILIFISLSRGGADPFTCFQYGAKPGVVSTLWQTETIVFLQPAVLLPFSCLGRIELSLAGGEGLDSTLGLLPFAIKCRRKPGAKNLLQSHFASSVPPRNLLPITLSDKMNDKGWHSTKILACDRAKNTSGSWEQLDEETSF